MTLFIPESSTFFFVLCDYVIYDNNIYSHSVTDIIPLLCFVTCMTVIYDVILHLLSESKIKNENYK